LIDNFGEDLPDFDGSDRMQVYESRNRLYLAALANPVVCFDIIRQQLNQWLQQHDASPDTVYRALQLLALDAQLCPRTGPESTAEVDFEFDVLAAYEKLSAMELPADNSLAPGCYRVRVRQPGGVGEILFDADGGSWLRGEVEAIAVETVNLAALA
jgi:hypothetical protein